MANEFKIKNGIEITTQSGTVPIDEFSTDITFAGNSDTAVPTEKAVKTYVDNKTANTIDKIGAGHANKIAVFDASGDIIDGAAEVGDLATKTEVNSKEDSLGNPASNGQILSSETDGTRSWIDFPETQDLESVTDNGATTSNKITYSATQTFDSPNDLVSKKFVDDSIANIIGGLNFIGTWDANTNTPNISATSPKNGDYYQVSLSGATDLSGETDWSAGDWAMYVDNGTVTEWQKVDNTQEQQLNPDWNASSGVTEILNKPTDITDLSTHSASELSDITSVGSGSIISTAERTAIGTNATGIASNAGDIATNVSAISTNAGAIASNATDISDANTAIGTNATNIATNSDDITAANTAIANNTTAIGTNLSAIGTINTDLGNKADKVSSATAGGVATLDAAGNLTDGGFKLDDAATGPNVLLSQSKIAAMITAGGNGTVSGPVSSTNNNIAVFDGTTGTLIKDSSVSIENITNVKADWDETNSSSAAFIQNKPDLSPNFGTTGARPASPENGAIYFDSTLGYPIWYAGTEWVNATGAQV